MMETPQQRILLELGHGPSHVAGLYQLEPHDEAPLVGLNRLLNDLEQLEAGGLIRAEGVFEPGDRARLFDAYRTWLPQAADVDLSVDEVGLNYELTDAGRAAVQAQLGPRDREDQWIVVLHDFHYGLIRVIGADEEIVARALAKELKRRGVNERRHLKTESRTVDRYVLPDGFVIADGVEYTYHYLPGDSPARTAG
jgi:hypothetical protein